MTGTRPLCTWRTVARSLGLVGLLSAGWHMIATAGTPGVHVTEADGSSGFLEVTSNQASAAKLLGCAAGSPVELTLYR